MISMVARASVSYATIAAQALAAFEHNPYAIDAGFVRGRVCREPITFQEFARDHADVWRAPSDR